MLKLDGRIPCTFEPTPYPPELHQLSSSTVLGMPVRNLISLWEPSQYGLMAEAPQRHRATVFRCRGTGSPDGVTISKSPRIRIGPSGQSTTELGSPGCLVS